MSLKIEGRKKDVSIVSDIVTRIFVLLSYRTSIESVGNYEKDGQSTAVYWISTDSDMLAQATLLGLPGTIIANKRRLSGADPVDIQVVMEHELGHLSVNPIFKGIYIGSLINFAVGLYLIWHIVGAVLSSPTAIINETIVSGALVGLLLIVLFGISVRLDEIHAELCAVREVGEEEYLKVKEKDFGETELSILSKIRMKIMYPKPRNVVRLHNLIK